MNKRKKLSRLASLIGGTLFVTTSLWATGAMAAGGLTKDDCIKCHDKPPQDINSNGGAHKSKVSCVDCHAGHAPKKNGNIPACSQCHSGNAHYKLQGCLNCHTNPHTPLVITIGSNVTEPCLSCHTEQMGQLQQYKSKHSAVACSTCHREKHGLIPDCSHCHSPHVKGQTTKECLTCHKAHMPREVSYPESTPSSLCAACHADVYKQITTNPAKHAKLACATCHKEKHKMIPKCQGCHGENPHPAQMHVKFPQCSQCHGTAHNLHK